jgi:phage gp29-like protein
MPGMLFNTLSATAYQRYAYMLRDALMMRDWVYDPSFALASDWDIYQKVMRDPVAAHAIRYRKHMVAGTEWRIEPASDRTKDKRAAEIIEDILDSIHNFTDARIRIADSIFTGSSYAFICGEKTTKSVGGSEQREWWCPYNLKDVDRRRFRRVYNREELRHYWEFWSVEKSEWEELENPEWFIHSVYDDVESSLGYGRGLLDTLYQFQACKARILQDSMAASERYGQGFLTVGVDNMRGPDGRPVAGEDNSGTTIAQEWSTELEKHKARHILVHDARDEVKMINGFGEGYQMLTKLIEYFDTSMVTAVLGSNLPTTADRGGSYAMAVVQADSSEALIQADRLRISDEITRDLIGACWRYNYANLVAEGLGDAKMPRFRIVNQKKEDPKEAAPTIERLLNAGIELRKDEVYRKTGFTMPMPEDDTISQVAGFRSGLHEELTGSSPDGEGAGVGRSPDGPTVPEDQALSDEALSGTQISSLKEIVISVANGELNPEAAIELVIIAYPGIPRERAEKMIGSAGGVSVDSGRASEGDDDPREQEEFGAYFERLRRGNGHSTSTVG